MAKNNVAQPKATTQKARIVVNGNSQFMTRKIAEDGSEYLAPVVIWQGLVEASFDITREVTQYAADNDPAYVTIEGPATGTGTVTLFGVGNEEWQNIVNVEYSQDKGMRYGGTSGIVFFSLSLDEDVVSDGSKSRVIFYKCNIEGFPTITTSTRSTDNNAPRNVQFTVTLNPIKYTDGAESKTVLFDLVNSKENATRWAEIQDTILLP